MPHCSASDALREASLAEAQAAAAGKTSLVAQVREQLLAYRAAR